MDPKRQQVWRQSFRLSFHRPTAGRFTRPGRCVQLCKFVFKTPMLTFFSVPHSSEVPYVYGAVVNGSVASKSLSSNMIDYWVSFATSLDPNDGHGSKRNLLCLALEIPGADRHSGPSWPQYSWEDQVSSCLACARSGMMNNLKQPQVLLQLNGENTTVIPDTYRLNQIKFINDHATIWHHRRIL